MQYVLRHYLSITSLLQINSQIDNCNAIFDYNLCNSALFKCSGKRREI